MKHPILRIDSVSDEVYEVSDLCIERLSGMRIWLFDLEATGLDVTRERVTQIAGIPVEGGRILEDEAFVQYVYPGDGIEIPREVRELTGITIDKLKGAPSFAEAWPACVDAARGAPLWVGQSVFEFDVPLLEAELARCEMAPVLPPILDTVVVATGLLGKPSGRWSTSALLRHFGVSTDGLRRHDALDDVKILARVLLPMLRMIREDQGDRIVIPPGRRLAVKRHPPVRSAAR